MTRTEGGSGAPPPYPAPHRPATSPLQVRGRAERPPGRAAAGPEGIGDDGGVGVGVPDADEMSQAFWSTLAWPKRIDEQCKLVAEGNTALREEYAVAMQDTAAALPHTPPSSPTPDPHPRRRRCRPSRRRSARASRSSTRWSLPPASPGRARTKEGGGAGGEAPPGRVEVRGGAARVVQQARGDLRPEQTDYSRWAAPSSRPLPAASPPPPPPPPSHPPPPTAPLAARQDTKAYSSPGCGPPRRNGPSRQRLSGVHSTRSTLSMRQLTNSQRTMQQLATTRWGHAPNPTPHTPHPPCRYSRQDVRQHRWLGKISADSWPNSRSSC